MNMTMQQPLSYPFYMDAPYRPISVPFNLPSSHQQQFPLRYPIHQPLSQFVLSQQRNPLPRKIPSSSSFSNTRYHHLKQSTSYSNRRPVHRSVDGYTQPYRYSTYDNSNQYRPSKTKSTSNLEQISQFTSTNLPKAHSWHTMMTPRSSNLSVSYAKEMQLTPKRRRKHSPQKKKQNHPQRQLLSSPKRKPSFNNHRKRSIHIPERGVVRISTLDEMPIVNNQTHNRTNSINKDRLSMKGSISNSSKRRIKPKEKSNGNNSIKNRKIQNNDGDIEGTRIDSDTQSSSSSSSNHSHSSLQQRLNGSLRNDPLIIAAMEDYRQLRRSSSQTTSLISRHRDLSCDSLRSDSTFHSSPSSSISHSHSQSSFTSLERSEIRQLINTIKTKDTKSLNNPLQSSPIPASTSPSEQSITTNSYPSIPKIKPKKSSLTEELDREFNKLRSLDPNQDLTNVIPSAICKRKKTLEKPPQTIPPLPTFDELLRQVQLRPIDKSAKPICLKEKSPDDDYENSLSSIPVPRSSPIPSTDEIKPDETKHEYALPIKKTREKSLPQISHFQPIRNFKINKSITNIAPEKRTSRSLSMLNWFHNSVTNPFPTTFQPNQTINNQNEYGTTNVEENIYTSDINVYLPSATIAKNEDPSLQIHLDNQTILTDEFYPDYETKQTTSSSSILNDFSHLFTRKHRHQNKFHKKNQRCSIM